MAVPLVAEKAAQKAVLLVVLWAAMSAVEWAESKAVLSVAEKAAQKAVWSADA